MIFRIFLNTFLSENWKTPKDKNWVIRQKVMKKGIFFADFPALCRKTAENLRKKNWKLICMNMKQKERIFNTQGGTLARSGPRLFNPRWATLSLPQIWGWNNKHNKIWSISGKRLESRTSNELYSFVWQIPKHIKFANIFCEISANLLNLGRFSLFLKIPGLFYK